MRNNFDVLRSEIHRLAREEVRGFVQPLRKKVAELSRIGSAYKSAVSGVEKILSGLEPAPRGRKGRPRGGRPAGAGAARTGASSIRSLRIRLGLTQDEFARLAGVSGNAVWLWENGKIIPTERSMAAISALRGLDPEGAKRRLARSSGNGKPARSGRKPKATPAA